MWTFRHTCILVCVVTQGKVDKGTLNLPGVQAEAVHTRRLPLSSMQHMRTLLRPSLPHTSITPSHYILATVISLVERLQYGD